MILSLGAFFAYHDSIQNKHETKILLKARWILIIVVSAIVSILVGDYIQDKHYTPGGKQQQTALRKHSLASPVHKGLARVVSLLKDRPLNVIHLAAVSFLVAHALHIFLEIPGIIWSTGQI